MHKPRSAVCNIRILRVVALQLAADMPPRNAYKEPKQGNEIDPESERSPVQRPVKLTGIVLSTLLDASFHSSLQDSRCETQIIKLYVDVNWYTFLLEHDKCICHQEMIFLIYTVAVLSIIFI